MASLTRDHATKAELQAIGDKLPKDDDDSSPEYGDDVLWWIMVESIDGDVTWLPAG